MPSRFRLPTVSRRHFSLVLAILVVAVATAYLMDRAQQPKRIEAEALQAFRNTCMKEARRANGGGDLVMDDETEARLGAYCGCVSDAVAGNVPPAEIVRIGQGSASDTTMQLLTRIVEGCKPKLE